MATATKPRVQDTASPPDASGPAGLDAMIARATAAYRELVRRQARGDSIDQGELDKALVHAGRSLVQFGADAERLKKRFAAAALLDNVAELEKEIEPARRRVAEAGKELQCLNEQYWPKAAELEQKLGAAQLDLLRKLQQPSDRRRKALEVLQETAAPENPDKLRRLRIANSEAERQKLAAKHETGGNAPAFQKRTIEVEQAGIRRVQDLNAQLRDPVQGMAWEK